MKSKITKLAAAAVIIVVVFIGVNQFGGSIDGASIAWASVVEKLDTDIKASNTIHILLTICSKSSRTSRVAGDTDTESSYVKGEVWLRKDPMVTKTVIEGDQTVYFFEDSFIGLNHGSKTWFEQPISKEQERRKLYGFFDALVSGDFKTNLMTEELTVSDGKVVGQEMVEGEDATIYEFVGKSVETTEDATKSALVFRCWISNLTNRVLRLHQYINGQDEPFISYDPIEYNVDIPASTFDVKIPEEYTRSLSLEEKIMTTVPKDITEVKQAYDLARKNFPDYRMIILDSEGNVKNCMARKGEKWRVDTYRRDKGVGITGAHVLQGFSGAWDQLVTLQDYIERTVMSYNGGSLRGFWPRKNVAGLPKTLHQGHVGFFDIIDTLEYLAWPDMPLIGPSSKIEFLRPSQEYPGCIGIQYSQITNQKKQHDMPAINTLVIYWIDPSKDYICLRYERHQRKKPLWEEKDDWFENEATTQERVLRGIFHYSSEIFDITQLAQTPEGHWYPKEIKVQQHYLNNDGSRTIPSPEPKVKKTFVDTQGITAPSYFGWPEQLPLPEK